MDNNIAPTIQPRRLAKTIVNYAQASTELFAPSDVDKLELRSDGDYHKIVEQCRFFYRKDPLAGSVIEKIVDIGLEDVLFNYDSLSENEARVFDGIKPALLEFASACALEYLISGLVIPEVSMQSVDKETLTDMGVKKYNSLILPVSMWIRDPMSIKVKSTIITDKPSYFAKVDDALKTFIKNKGTYADGVKDPELYKELVRLYKPFVEAVKAGQLYIPLNPEIALRRKVMTGTTYPTPYLYRSLEAMKHKRNLRRMDYSIAARVMSAIQLIKVGSDDFPLVEGEEYRLADIEAQLSYRNGTNGLDTDRIFQLMTDHTTTIEWVMPPVEALLDDTKYIEVNSDIMFGLGFPRILVTGETERSNSSDPEFASLSPIKTMESIQREIIKIVNWIVRKVAKENNFKGTPRAEFTPINLMATSDFIKGLLDLYSTGNLSRTNYTKSFGFTLQRELELRQKEDIELDKMNLTPLAAKPFSTTPEKPNNDKTVVNVDESKN